MHIIIFLMNSLRELKRTVFETLLFFPIGQFLFVLCDFFEHKFRGKELPGHKVFANIDYFEQKNMFNILLKK